MMPKIRVIGDVHGHTLQYVALAKAAEYSVCVGDVGFDYFRIKELNAANNRIIGGNHDNYDKLSEHFLGDFGVHEVPGWGSFFYVRGAWSIDHKHREKFGKYKSWWAQEELTDEQMEAAYAAYESVKPDFVITHDAPLHVIQLMRLRPISTDFELGPQRTPRLLQRMFDAHQPKQWVYGHFHVSWTEVVKGCQFTCLRELEHKDFPGIIEPVALRNTQITEADAELLFRKAQEMIDQEVQ